MRKYGLFTGWLPVLYALVLKMSEVKNKDFDHTQVLDTAPWADHVVAARRTRVRIRSEYQSQLKVVIGRVMAAHPDRASPRFLQDGESPNIQIIFPQKYF